MKTAIKDFFKIYFNEIKITGKKLFIGMDV